MIRKAWMRSRHDRHVVDWKLYGISILIAALVGVWSLAVYATFAVATIR